MSAIRGRRLPISCEPCRIRKIRCPRDAAPCGSCCRRGVPGAQCVYARKSPASSSAPYARPQAPNSPLSMADSSASSTDASLAERVQKLEQMLQQQASQVPDCIQQVSAGPVLGRTGCSGPFAGDYGLPAGQVARHSVPRGVLRTSDTGYVRYFPHASRWNSVLGSSEDFDGSLSRAEMESTDGPHPFGKSGKQVLRALLVELPSVKLCAELKDVYFASFAPLFHILHDPTFDEQYALFESDPESVPLCWLALLFAILSTAITAAESRILHELGRRRDVASILTDLCQRYRSAAMQCLEADNYLWQHNVTTLQALIVLIHGINHSHGQAWTLLGLTYNLALSIGCHVDPSQFGLDIVECEERRRCWAGLMLLYTIQNTSMGNLGLQQASSTTRAPANLNDRDLEVGQMEMPPSSTGATQMSYILLKFRLYNICSDICSQVLGVQSPSSYTVRHLDTMIIDEQRQWEIQYLSHTRSAPLPLHHLVHLKVLNGYAHQLALLLHRPVLIDRHSDATLYHWSLTRCLESAKALLEIHRTMRESPEFAQFDWYNRGLGSFHAFHAAVVLLVLPLPMSESLAVRQLVQQCVDRFEAMRDLSPTSAKAAPILRRLLTTTGAVSQSSTLMSRSTLNHDQPLFYQDDAQRYMAGDYVNAAGPNKDSAGLDSVGLDALFGQFQPEQWLTPTGMAWDQWDCFLAGPPVIANQA